MPHAASKTPSRTSSPTPARIFAYEVCSAVRARDGFARELFASYLKDHPLSLEDAAFARVLVLGTVACEGTLDELIDSVLASPKDIDAEVRCCLRISAYELFFLHKQAHVAVDQGVALVGHVRQRARGVANFCLRRLAEKVDAFPFGNPNSDFSALARLHGLPLWMAEMLEERYGFAQAAQFMAVSNEAPCVWFSPNAIRTTAEHVEDALRQAGIDFIRAEGEDMPPYCYRLAHAQDVSAPAFLDLIEGGYVIVSDASAQAIAYAALPATPPSAFLEIGAGRGTKTLLLESAAVRKYGAQVPIVALDYLAFKSDLHGSRMATYGVTEARCQTGDGTKLDEVFGARTFDAIFIDAPCSGLGTLRRHPELRWKTTPDDLNSLAHTGAAMLSSAAAHLAPGGLLTYSTCTVTSQETTDVVRAFAGSAAFEHFTQIPFCTSGQSSYSPSLASCGPDAHFAVQFVRNAI